MTEYPTYGYQDELQARSTAEVVIETAIMIIITVTAIFGNLMVCWAVYRNKGLRTIPNIYVVVLAISDIMMAAIAMPPSIEVQITSKFLKSFTFCQIQGLLGFFSAFTSIQTMAAMAINRYYRVVKQGKYSKYFTAKRTIASVVIIVILAAFGASLHLVCRWAIHTIHYGKVTCFTTFKTPEHEKGYIAFLSIFYIMVPACIISTCYLKIFRTVCNHKKVAFKSTPKQSSSKQGESTEETEEDQQEKQANAQINVKEVKITKTLFVTALGFTVCWAPIAVIDVIQSSNALVIPRQVFLLWVYLAHGSSSINPFIYGVLNRSFRREFRDILRFRRSNKIERKAKTVPARRNVQPEV